MTDSIGLFGGTFDPVHFGHLRTAVEVHEALGLSSVRFIPGADPPHRGAPKVSAAQRAAMVQIAIAQYPAFSLDERELRRAGRSYTVLTLESLREELGEAVPLCWIVGMDAFLGLPDWYRWQELLTLANLAVMVRPGYTLDTSRFPPGYLQRYLRSLAQWQAAQPAGQIVTVEVTQLAISATLIRRSLAAGQSVDYLMPQRQLEYLQLHGLYAVAAG